MHAARAQRRADSPDLCEHCGSPRAAPEPPPIRPGDWVRFRSGGGAPWWRGIVASVDDRGHALIPLVPGGRPFVFSDVQALPKVVAGGAVRFRAHDGEEWRTGRASQVDGAKVFISPNSSGGRPVAYDDVEPIPDGCAPQQQQQQGEGEGIGAEHRHEPEVTPWKRWACDTARTWEMCEEEVASMGSRGQGLQCSPRPLPPSPPREASLSRPKSSDAADLTREWAEAVLHSVRAGNASDEVLRTVERGLFALSPKTDRSSEVEIATPPPAVAPPDIPKVDGSHPSPATIAVGTSLPRTPANNPLLSP